MTQPLIEQLRQICGDANVLTHDDPATDLSPWEQDWRKRVRGRALAVVRPDNTAQVAAVVKACAATSTPIVPQGGNTGLVVGSTPDDSGTQIVLNLQRMNAKKYLYELYAERVASMRLLPFDPEWDGATNFETK